ncbi:MAG: hypothetical protein M3Z27_07860 [Actinomycetota bacterium]|nr:hypothetical protein [Actinomycetota bacterium]
MLRLRTVILLACLALAGCGFNVATSDLFVLHRSGQGRELTLLVSDGATVRCNGGPPRPISDALLLQARDLADALDKDVKAGLRPASAVARSVYTYTVKLQDGTIAFADTDAGAHAELGRAQLFTAQLANGTCAR